MTCPNGFVIPDDLNSTDNWYPNRTLSECAFRCDHFILYTENEWQTEILIKDLFTYFCFFGLTVVIFVVIVDCRPSAIRQFGYFMEMFMCTSYLKLIVDMIVSNQPVGERLSRNNNADFLDETDGFTGCAVQAHIFIMQTVTMFVLTWVLLSMNMFCSTVLHWRMEKLNKYKYVYIIFIILFPTAFSGGGIKMWGSDLTFNQCFPNGGVEKLTAFRRIFRFVLVVLGTGFMLSSLAKVCWFAFTLKVRSVK